MTARVISFAMAQHPERRDVREASQREEIGGMRIVSLAVAAVVAIASFVSGYILGGGL